MYIKSNSFKSIALLLIICLTGILALPSLNPQQNAEADVITDPDFWVAVVASAVGSGAVDSGKILIEQILYRWVHKKGTDPNSEHGEGGHVKEPVLINDGSYKKRWYCPVDVPKSAGLTDNVCGAEHEKKEELTKGGHCVAVSPDTCVENPSDGTLEGCGLEIYKCTKKYHQADTCKCGEAYRHCRPGSHGENCDQPQSCTCCSSDVGCVCTDCTCEDCPHNKNKNETNDNTCGYDDSTCGYSN